MLIDMMNPLCEQVADLALSLAKDNQAHKERFGSDEENKAALHAFVSTILADTLLKWHCESLPDDRIAEYGDEDINKLFDHLKPILEMRVLIEKERRVARTLQ